MKKMHIFGIAVAAIATALLAAWQKEARRQEEVPRGSTGFSLEALYPQEAEAALERTVQRQASSPSK